MEAGKRNGKVNIREWAAKALLLGGIAALLFSLQFPYWRIRVSAPQYPKGLVMEIYVHRLGGDVHEIDLLNHYIGMRASKDAAKLERKLAVPGMALLALLLFAAVFLPSAWSALLCVPALAFPVVFAGDLFWWLRDSGLNLNPKAPLSHAVKPFVPPLFGEGKIAQFVALAKFEPGYYLALLAAAMIAAALLFRIARAPGKKVWLMAGAGIVALLALIPPVEAQTLTVSDKGPYPSIDAALAAAADGDEIFVRGGVHRGPLKIEKRVRLIGGENAVIDGGGRGTVIELKAPRTELRGFTVLNSGEFLSSDDAAVRVSGAGSVIEDNVFENVLFGIDFHHAPGSAARRNVLRGKAVDAGRRGDLIRVWYSDGVIVESNRAVNGRDIVLWYSKNSKFRGNVFEGGRYGIHFMYCNGSAVEENRFVKNSVGAYLMYSADILMRGNFILSNRGPSGYGIGFKDMNRVRLEGNVIADNRVGFFLDGVTGEFRGNVLAFNDAGIEMFPTAKRNRFDGNSFVDNGEQVTVQGMGAAMVENDWRGNYWSDYRGFDADRDGRGDVAYQSVRFFERLADRFPCLKLFSGNPSAQALDFASNLFPLFAPQPALTDSEPLMAPALVHAGAAPRGPALPWFFLSGTLILPAGVLLARRDPAKAVSGTSRPPVSLPAAPEIIRVERLDKKFGKTHAVDSVSFTVRKGQTVVLWGPNGAGKTTVLRCLLGIFKYQGGLEVLGLDVARRGKEARRHIGYVPQEIRMHGDQTVWETVCFYARLRRVSPGHAKELLEKWGLAGARGQSVNNLSGGMKQKLALVIALLDDPPILFLDESTNHLDLHTRHEFVHLLSGLKSAGKTIVFCSHRHSEVWKLADRVIVLKEGKTIDEGTPEEVRRHLGGSAVLALTVRPQDCGRAGDILRNRGFAVEKNQTQLLVEVPVERKAEPLIALSQASIPLLDFDLEHPTNA